MDHTIRRVEYFYTTVHDRPGEALRFLTSLAELGVNLLAFTAIPSGMMHTQLMIFPEDPFKLTDQSERAGFQLQPLLDEWCGHRVECGHLTSRRSPLTPAALLRTWKSTGTRGEDAGVPKRAG